MNKHKRHGFTIIEVVVVLAIAGLIFLMVFITLPALQRSQRNSGYKTIFRLFWGYCKITNLTTGVNIRPMMQP